DEVLRTLGQRLLRLDTDTQGVARVGGGEFVAIKRYRSDGELQAFLNDLTEAFTTGMMIDAFELKPGASFGVAVYPRDGNGRDGLLNNADLAMYRAKASPTEDVCYYDSSMDEAERDRRLLARDLWLA